MAQTRLGEDSVVTIPLWLEDGFIPETLPDFDQSKLWCQRAISLLNKRVVKNLKKVGVPEGWKNSTLLRNYFPLVLNDENCWIEDVTVRLDEDLGLVYDTKEAE